MKINDAYAPGQYVANEGRYNDMKYRRCGRSGILLPALSMGLWHNLGHTDDLENTLSSGGLSSVEPAVHQYASDATGINHNHRV